MNLEFVRLFVCMFVCLFDFKCVCLFVCLFVFVVLSICAQCQLCGCSLCIVICSNNANVHNVNYAVVLPAMSAKVNFML
jgi:hypothetical protein